LYSTTEITLGALISSLDTTVMLLGLNVGPLSWRSAGESGGIIIAQTSKKWRNNRQD
jgi:hypothetical protein